MSILSHAEFGKTISRDDGLFDISVNGGGMLNVRYEKEGFLSAQREEGHDAEEQPCAEGFARTAIDAFVVVGFVRRRLLQLPGRLTRSAPRWTLHPPARWPWQQQFIEALTRIPALPAA